MNNKRDDENYSEMEAGRRYRATLANVLATRPDHRTKPSASPKKRGRPRKAQPPILQPDAKRRRLRPLTKGAGFSGGSHSVLMGAGLTRLVIGQPLAFDALKRFGGALVILDAELRAVAVAEIELFQVAVQMRLAD